jgi:hypothetical protein
MSARRIEIAPERVAEGRELYENTLTPIRDIAKMMGLSLKTFDTRIAEWKWQRRRYTSGGQAAVEVAASAPVLPEQTSAELPADFANRLQRIINAHCDAVERTLRVVNPQNDAEAERSTRTLATIARAVAEITATANTAGRTTPNEADDDPVPRDIDEFRYALARRIRGFIEQRQKSAAGISGPGKPEVA